MPQYNLFLFLKSYATPQTSTNLLRSLSRTVISSGGVVRSIENAGLRKMPHRVKAKFQDSKGVRYHDELRLVSMRFIASPGEIR